MTKPVLDERTINILKRGKPFYGDWLYDKNCVILDGECDCLRKPGASLPECKKYTQR